MAKFKLGDLVLNRWASDSNPTRVFCYIKNRGKYTDVVALDDKGKLAMQKYYSSSLNETKDGEDAYMKIGRTNAFDVLKHDIETAREAEDRTIRLKNGSIIEIQETEGGLLTGSRADKINLW